MNRRLFISFSNRPEIQFEVTCIIVVKYMNWVWKMKKRRSILSPYNLVVEIKQVLPLQLGKWHLFTCQRNFKDIIYQKMNVETHYQGNLFTSENTSFTSLPCTETNCKRKENYWRRNDGQNNGEINDIRILNWLQNSLTVIFNTWGFFFYFQKKACQKYFRGRSMIGNYFNH